VSNLKKWLWVLCNLPKIHDELVKLKVDVAHLKSDLFESKGELSK
jgi:hypothetical protein